MNPIADVIADLLFAILTGGERRGGPRVDVPVVLVATVLGTVTGLFLYTKLFQNGSVGMVVWLLIPFAATFLVVTVLGRGHAIRGGLFASALALFVAVPLAALDVMFGFWA